jgi:hypothetical protein
LAPDPGLDAGPLVSHTKSYFYASRLRKFTYALCDDYEIVSK